MSFLSNNTYLIWSLWDMYRLPHGFSILFWTGFCSIFRWGLYFERCPQCYRKCTSAGSTENWKLWQISVQQQVSRECQWEHMVWKWSGKLDIFQFVQWIFSILYWLISVSKAINNYFMTVSAKKIKIENSPLQFHHT